MKNRIDRKKMLDEAKNCTRFKTQISNILSEGGGKGETEHFGLMPLVLAPPTIPILPATQNLIERAA